MTLAVIILLSIFLVARFAVWQSRKDWYDKHGEESYREAMAALGLKAPDEFPSFWKFVFSRDERA